MRRIASTVGVVAVGALAVASNAVGAETRWKDPTRLGGRVPGEPVVYVDGNSGNGERRFWYVGANEQMYSVWRVDNRNRHVSYGGLIRGRPAPADHFVAYRGDDGGLYATADGSPGNAHSSLGGELASDPAATRTMVFYKGMDGHLYAVPVEPRNVGTLTQPEYRGTRASDHIDLGGTVTGPITAYEGPDREVHVFHSQNGPLRHLSLVDGRWQSELLGGDVRGRVAVAASGDPYDPVLSVFYRGTNRRLYMVRGRSSAQGRWSGHYGLGGDLPSDPVAVAMPQSFWVRRGCCHGIPRVDVFYRGTNGYLYHLTCVVGCSGHRRVPVRAVSGPAAYVWSRSGDFQFHVGYVGADRALYELEGVSGW